MCSSDLASTTKNVNAEKDGYKRNAAIAMVGLVSSIALMVMQPPR